MTSTVLITGKLHPEAIEAFEKDELINLVYKPDSKFSEFKDDLARAQVLVTRSETAIDRHLLDHAPELKIVARAAVGVGNIDLDYATEKGILVMNTPGKNTNSAAELTMGLILGLMRHLPKAHGHMKTGGWDRHQFTGVELRGKKVGIVGLGNVGHRVAKFCRGFDAEILAYDPYISPEKFHKHGATQIKSLEELASQCDILTLHVPKNKETTGMITKEILGSLGPDGFVINAARGGIIDEASLLEALDEGLIAGAALDTFNNEPDPMPALVKHEKLVVSPHIGASTLEAQLAIGKTVVEQVKKALEGAVVDYHVNLPDIGVIDSPIIKAYSTLAEKLGSIVGQIIDFNPQDVRFQYRGDLAKVDNSIIKLSFMKGYASHVVDGFVSFVNAANEFDKLGIRCHEQADPDFSSYRNAIKVHVTGPNNKSLTIGGVVFDGRHLRLTLINDFFFEVEPRGHIVLLENDDKPGVVGDIGVSLAKGNINISSFNLSRNKQGGKAMALLGVDSPLEHHELKGIQSINHVTKVRAMRL